MTRRVVLPAIAIALADLAALGLLIGWVGASRAYSVGLHMLFRDHLPAVAVTLASTAMLALALGRSLRAPGELALVVGGVVAADVVAALAVTLVVDEMRRVAEHSIPRAIVTVTISGLQPLAVGAGASIGHLLGGSRRRGDRAAEVCPRR